MSLHFARFITVNIIVRYLWVSRMQQKKLIKAMSSRLMGIREDKSTTF